MSEFDIFGDVPSVGGSAIEGEKMAETPAKMPSLSAEAQAYLLKRNKQKQKEAKKADTSTTTMTTTTTTTTTLPPSIDTNSYGPLWIPSYLHPSILIISAMDMGGSRDVTTSSPLSPGTLILREKPLLLYPDVMTEDEKTGNKQLDFSVVSSIFSRPDTAKILKALAPLHPQRLSDLPARSRTSRIKSLKSNYQSEIDLIVAGNHGMDEPAVLRLWFVVSMNGFDSGLSLYSAMLNHATNANAVRYFVPESEPTTATINNNDDDDEEEEIKTNISGGFSEVYITRHVARGEGIRIDYLFPRLQDLKDRREYFSAQHFFDLADSHSGDNVGPGVDEMAIQNVQNALIELESSMGEVSNVVTLMVSSKTRENIETVVANAVDLETASKLLLNKAEDFLRNKDHFLVVRALKLHCDAAELFFKITDFEARKLGQKDTIYRLKVLGGFLGSSRRLLHIQRDYLGEFHPDLGRIHSDIAMAVGGLVGEGVEGMKVLKAVLGDDEGSSVIKAAKYESDCRNRFEEIDTLYKSDGGDDGKDTKKK